MASPSKIATTLPILAYRKLLRTLNLQRTRAVVKPFRPKPPSTSDSPLNITAYDYSPTDWKELNLTDIHQCIPFIHTPSITWINLSGTSPEEVALLSQHYGIHQLLQEDILVYGQRPKMDEINDVMFAQLHMLYMHDDNGTIEQEQISIVLGKKFVVSFQEDAQRDVFDPIRKKIKLDNSKIRNSTADHLFYSMIDIIVDSYFQVIEKVGEQIEQLEEIIMERSTPHTFQHITQLRKDLILLKRNTLPVRDLISSIIRSESELLEDNTTKYFKDVYDHIVQANDLTENYREILMGMQDLYMSNINLRMNEVMKTLAILTAIMAPATVIGGVFGMNFTQIPMADYPHGFAIAIGLMIIIPIFMLYWFYKRNWFQKEIPTKTD